MASSKMHLAVVKRYLERNNLAYNREMLAGTLYPDTVKNKAISHYTMVSASENLVIHLSKKVNLYSFLLDSEPLDDFQFGWFLHLVTDYLFFKECFSREYLLSKTFDEFRKEMYFAYDCLNKYIEEKYGVVRDDYLAYPSLYYEGIPYQECIFTKEMIDLFIERVSSIDVSRYIRKIKENKGNILP